MTTEARRRPVPVPPPVRARSRGAALPWCAAAATLIAALLLTGTPVTDIARYAGYWLIALLIPGTLVHRALRGSRGNLPEDLGFGAVTGLLLELAAWACAAAAGRPDLLRWWPLPVWVAFAAVPRLRRHWRITDPRPLPLRWSYGIAATLVLITGWAAARWAATPLPPVTVDYYQDLLYHLGLVQELTRAMPFEVPHVAGAALRYHYLSDAHLAAASLTSGSSPATVLLRLWIVPVAAAAVLVTAALARDVTGRWWAGPLVAVVAYVGAPVGLGSPVAVNGGSPLSYVSPSQTFAMPFLIVLTALCADLLRGRRLGAGWALLPALAFVCTGAKSSALPPLLAGLLAAGTAMLLRDRRLPWPVAGAASALAVAVLAGLRVFAGGGAGTLSWQLFGIVRWLSPYTATLSADDGVGRGGLVPPGVAQAGGAGRVLLVTIVVWWAAAQAARFAGLATLAGRSGRGDPVVWLLAGALTAGTGAAWVLYHPSASQIYFFVGVIPFGVLLAVRLMPDTRGPAGPIAAFALGAAVPWLIAPDPRPADGDLQAWTVALTASTARLVALGAAGALAASLLHRRYARSTSDAAAPGLAAPHPDPCPDQFHPARRPVTAAAVSGAVAALFGASVAAGAVPSVTRALTNPPVAVVADRLKVTNDEMRAALWLDAHARDDDLVATNVHCQPVRTVAHCDARAFWVTGLGGHRALVESWGYGDAAVAAHGHGGRAYPAQPAPDPAVFALNERVFTDPDAADLDRLRALGVRWLFADSRAGTVSARLATLTRPRHTCGPVTVYELP